jgi:hypothetical protein
MSLIKKNSTQIKSVHTPPVKVTAKPAVEAKVEAPKTKEVTQQETFVPSTVAPPKAESQDAPKVQSETKPKPKELPKPRPGSDMALMLEDMESAKLAGGELKSGSNGTLFVTDDGLISMGNPESVQSKEQEKPQTLQQMLAGMNSEQVSEGEVKDHEHGHGPKHGEDAALGGHLGTEVVEKVGHNAHHAVEHAAGHGVAAAKGHAAAEVVTQAKGHGASHVAEAVTQAKGHGAHHAAEVVTQVKGHGAHHAAEVLGDAVSQSGSHGLAETHEATAEAAKHGGEAAHHLSTGLTTALGASAAISGGIGGYMLYAGGKELAHGVKEKDGEKIAEGVGGLAVGARSVAASTVMASMASGSGVLADVASVASKTLTPLGVVHGAIDVGLGVKDLVKGDKIDGLIKVGFGTSVIAGALVGGIPLTIAAIGMLGVKVGRGIYKGRQAKKAAAQAETAQQQNQSVQPPANQIDHNTATKDVKT